MRGEVQGDDDPVHVEDVEAAPGRPGLDEVVVVHVHAAAAALERQTATEDSGVGRPPCIKAEGAPLGRPADP